MKHINYDELVKIADTKIKEIEAVNEKENEELKKLLKLRGDIVANGEIGLIDVEREQKNIYELSKKIRDLKDKIEENEFTLTSLKEKINTLKSEREKQDLELAISKQNRIEGELARASEKLISQVKEANNKNTELRTLIQKWNEVSKKTGKTNFTKKVSLGSESMLGTVAGVLLHEWSTGDLSGRHIYKELAI